MQDSNPVKINPLELLSLEEQLFPTSKIILTAPTRCSYPQLRAHVLGITLEQLIRLTTIQIEMLLVLREPQCLCLEGYWFLSGGG